MGDILKLSRWGAQPESKSAIGGLGAVAEAERLLRSGYDELRAVRGGAHKKTVEAHKRLVAFEATRHSASAN